jgi:LPS sulfotransferase NodH
MADASHPPDLFFVIGAPKSGTTWLEKAMDAHPEVACRGEGKFHMFRDELVKATESYNRFLVQRNQQVFGRQTFPKVDIDELDKVFRAFVAARMAREPVAPGVKRLGTKDPDIGLYMTDFAPVFPEVDYLHILRDPRDTALSMWHHMQRVHPGVDTRPLMASLIDTARGWSDYLRITHGEVKARGLSYLEVRYEDMVADGPAALTRVFGFLKVRADAETVAACIEATTFRRMSRGRDAGQEDRKSFFRKGVAGGWRDELTEAQGAEVLAAAGPGARELGYV